MSVDLVQLRGSELDAAVRMSASRSVVVRGHPCEVEGLRELGFLEGPAAIESFVRAPMGMAHCSRRVRRAVARSVSEWDRRRLRLELLETYAYGVERFIETVYFPFFARSMYEYGIAPHGANDLVGLEKLLTGNTRVALVRTDDGSLVGGALLRESEADEARFPVRGTLPVGRWEEGLIYALDPALEDCQRALLAKLAEAVAPDSNWFSLGRDLAWCESAYAGVLFEKIRLAESVVVCLSHDQEFYSVRPQWGERFAFFEWVRDRRALRAHLFGTGDDPLPQVIARLTDDEYV